MRTLITLAAVGLMALSNSTAVAQATAEMTVGLDGYCPVCIVDGGKWMKGNPEISAEYDGATYYFPEAGARDKFVTAPEKYVPALDGDCIVCYAKGGKRIAGSVQHAAAYEGRVFLFPSPGEKQMFLDDPARYADADIAADGNCIVCQVKAGKEVPGSTEFTAIRDGLRYLFPSDKERQMFLTDPAMFVTSTAAPMKEMKVAKTEMAGEMMAVSVEGRSACAACEFRVHPLNDPDQLGLAVKTDDGNVYVVEGAHAAHPQIYKDRFEQVRLNVSGKVLKTEGNVTWIDPTGVNRVN